VSKKLKYIKNIFSPFFLFNFVEILKLLVFEKVDVMAVFSSLSDREFLDPLVSRLEESGTKVLFVRLSSHADKSSTGETVLHPYMLYFLKSPVLLTTSTGFESGKYPHIQNIIHVPHSIVSFHMIYPERAFTGFDRVICAGPHHTREIEALNKRYDTGTVPIEGCYPKMALLRREYPEYSTLSDEKEILIAPSWGEGNILQSCGNELISILLERGYRVVLRPHPHFFVNEKRMIEELIGSFLGRDGFILENSTESNRAIYTAGCLISDYSGIAFEYAFLRKRAVVFVDVPKKIINPDYLSIGIEPIEISAREELGLVVDENPNEIADAVDRCLRDFADFTARISMVRERYLFGDERCDDVVKHINALVQGGES
jgi:YidC/Oxa1 family membrane protein insertase